MTIVSTEDRSRPIWPACPSLGWAAGVHRLTGLPNGNALKSVAEAEAERAGAQTCTFIPGYDVDASGFETDADTKEDCCQDCWDNAKCASAVWLENTGGARQCWIKYGTARVASTKPTIQLCIPDGKPVRRTIETHVWFCFVTHFAIDWFVSFIVGP